MPYDHVAVESKWRELWAKHKIFEVDPSSKPKYFITVAYPYPNSPQHVGHGRTYTLADVHARFRRMQGFNVLFPMGFHYTGTPILAMSKRIAAGDQELIDLFKALYHVPGEQIKNFAEPLNIARYFHEEIRTGMQEMGYSIDWRREFTTIDPVYNKFIEWQFRKLQSKGFITRGSHPVGWCPSCGNPVGQHDTQGDKEPEIGEFVAIKFKADGFHLVAGTLRPETIFGVTNIWVNPEATYVEAEVDSERWVVSKRAAEKLPLLGKKASVLRELKGSELLKLEVEVPLTGRKVRVLPAEFVDPNNVTGVVMSVPAHAPYDYLALRDLAIREDYLAKYGFSRSEIKQISPIQIIKVKDIPGAPAVYVVEQLGVKDQNDPKAEDATKEVYSKEFHHGVMMENTMEFSGMPVSEAKEKVREKLIEMGAATIFYELLNRPIYCRCGAEVVVKIFEDQWFINYRDPSWKQLAKECLKNMRIIPEDLQQEFENVIDWLREKACARKSGLGTRLPWDPDWVIESLSDSTIYMAYYIVSKYVNLYNLKAVQFGDEVFDYVFLGEGDPVKIAEKYKLPIDVLSGMRREYSYFYPLDARHSGRDLVPNHLTFFIFNHVAIFPREFWPRAIVVNGSVLMEGKKMSKSLGNIIPLRDAIREFGADTIRLAVISTAEILQDADFSIPLAKSIREKLNDFYDLVQKVVSVGAGEKTPRQHTYLDEWILSRIEKAVAHVTNAMENFRVREAIHTVLYVLDQEVRWYLRRALGGKPIDGKTSWVLRKVLNKWIRLLAPFAPYLAEETWSMIGGDGFVSLAEWPSVEEQWINEQVELEEEFFKAVIEDTQEILRVTSIKPKVVYYYTAPQWKWKLFREMISLFEEGSFNLGSFIKESMKKEEIRAKGKEAVSFIQNASKYMTSLSPEMRRGILKMSIDEQAVLERSRGFLEKLFNAQVKIFRADSPDIVDPAGKAKGALPLRPAIYLEGG